MPRIRRALFSSVKRIGRSHVRLSSVLSLVMAVVLVSSTLIPADRASANFLAGTNESVLSRPPQLQPGVLGDGSVIGLQYGDPAEQMVVMDPPEPNNQGGAQLQHPLLIPSGRGGFQPNLVLNYDSTSGSSWVGTGWDLSVGEIRVDTRWGVPRYDAGKESETYLLDGDVLSPTAVRSVWQNRVSDRSDFTRRVESTYNLIIRHGDSPKNYWWEVRDKMGGIRWYGGFPDDGGPDVNAVSSKYPSLKQDPSAIQFDDKGNAYRWALSAQRDVGVNMIRYFYESVPGHRVGNASATAGRQLYLSRIRYTAAASASPGPADDPAYEVRFFRDGSITPAPTPRRDVLIDARGGFLQVTSDLLRRVEIWHGQPLGGAERSYNELARRYDLHYTDGAFAKTLLTSVDQQGSDGHVYGRHDFEYYDEVRTTSGGYNGFTGPTSWNTGTDNLQRTVLGPTNLSALGASETNAGDVHAYIGFNPADPLKEGSFGGAITINGGATEAQAEMLDINGDGLPDKVFRDGGGVSYRLNTSGPNRVATFGDKRPIVNLSRLSTEADIGLAVGAEAHLGVDVVFTVSGDVTIGEDYFADANSDGLPDFVSAGTVYFNHLDPTTGNPTFDVSSDGTPVPINVTTTTLPASQQITDLEAQRRAQSPLQDTLRRWVAPFNGTIAIDAPATLDPTPVPGVTNPPYTGDGVRVAIQHNATQLWTSTLNTPGGTASPTGVSAINVAKGDRIYFRLQSIDDGARDQVRWDPRISYTFSAPVDVNGLGQSAYHASDDFTLAGRPHTLGIAPLAGTLEFAGRVHKTRATSDDVTVQVLKNGSVVFNQLVSAATVNAAGIPLTTTDIPVVAPTATAQDRLEVRIAADSPIDVTTLQLDYTLAYTNNPTIALDIPADVDIYAENTLVAPRSPWTSDLARTVTTHASLNVAADNPAGTVNVTVKSAAGVVARGSITVPHSVLPQTVATDINTTLVNGTNYWFDFSVRDPGLSDKTSGPAVQLRWNDGAAQTRDVPSVLNWAGHQGIFPISYRGWGFAGYNGDSTRAAQPIDETALVLNPADFPQNPTPPSGFNDTTYKDPSKGPAYAFIADRVVERDRTGAAVDTLLAWRGMKQSILGMAATMRSSRTGADSPSLGITSGGGVQAVRRVGIAAPVFSLMAGVGPASVSFGAGPSFGLQDYTDMNGDGFPDIIGPGYIKYTNPRGGFYDTGSGVSVVNQDTTFAVNGGLGGDAVDIKSNSKGDVHTAQKTAPVSGTGGKATNASAASTGGSAAESQYGANVGGSIGISASFTNPSSVDPSYADALNKTPVDQTAPFELTFADVNGDGLPDRVRETPQGVFVQFNLGYTFADEVAWSGGGFENNESYSGSYGPQLGFKTPNREFSAGLGLSESISIPRYVWIDVDGDGILDRLHKDTTGDRVTVAFGTNSGLLPDVPYGTMASGTFNILGGSIPVGQQIASDVGTGLGAGADFTVGIGPLCLVACYLIINPGVHFDHSVSNTQVALVDVDGDGYPDSVASTADNQISVRFNNRGRTNLLHMVSNPLGGKIRLGYERDGNTVQQPNSIWTLARVEVDDGRANDGVDVKLSTFEYTGARYNRLEREMLGYSSVIERQRSFADNSVLRSVEQTYLNDNIFDSGLLTSQVLKAPDGHALQETRSTWSLIDLATNSAANLAADPVILLNVAVAAVQTRTEQRWFDASGGVGEETWSTFEYDALGNVLIQVDVGEPEAASDDVTATMEFTGCDNASTPGNYTRVPSTCNQAATLAGGVPPFWSRYRGGNPCPTWTSLPATLTITAGGGQVLRQRDGAPALCDNSSVTDQREWFGTGPNDFVESLLSYDAWGSYNHIDYPQNATGQRLTVDYVYDDDSHANVGDVIDSHGLRATATFDGRTGRIASRTDANNQVTSYTYDAFGRLETVTGPYEQGTATPTVRFEYHADSPGYAYAIAHNFDVRHPANTIDTATFVDGVGRQTQTKQDATVYSSPSSPATDVMLVSPFTEYDALGRPITVRYPVQEPLGSIGTFNTNKAGGLTRIDWDLLDRQTRLETPGALVTTTRYEFADFTSPFGFSARLFRNTVTDPQGKPQTTWLDVHGTVWAVEDGTPSLRTDYGYDPLGQLLQVRDTAGNLTSHTYDALGRRISSRTPDGGSIDFQFDGANNLIAQTTPNLRARNQRINYAYDIDRLVGITYPTGTPNVTYTYGDAGAAGNAAGRITTVVDGARTQQLTYDALGTVASEVATMNLHNGPSAPLTTAFTHDGFGRMVTVTYPDGEVLSHQYDSGGLLSSLQGIKGTLVTDYLRRQEYDEFQSKRYQEFGNGVHTEFNFDADTRRLARQVTNTAVRKIQDLNYTYDRVGNVLTMDNQLPPPQTELKGGPSRQTYTYDGYYRVVSATGYAPRAPGKRLDYTYAVTYDSSGNLASKAQQNVLSATTSTGAATKPQQVQDDTTYTWNPIRYNASTVGPHQIASAGGNTYSYDLNGNFSRVVDSKNRVQRTVTWDAANRVRNIDDGSNSTDYLYDQQGLLGVQRGPQGEISFVNNWYNFSNDGWFWRQIWADGDRIAQATEQVDPLTGITTLFRYYQHEDLQGSSNVVTDATGLVFEHIEYFPSGEMWIQEKSTTHRTPYRFAGTLNDEVRNLDVMGQRFYQPREQVFFSPEPMLYDDPDSTIGDPGLLPAYTYGESNGLRLYDNDGTAPKDVTAKLSTRFSAGQILQSWTQAQRHSRLWQSLVRLALTKQSDKLKAFTERFEIKPLLEINLTRTDEGHKLQSIEAGFLRFGKTLYEAPLTNVVPPRPTAPTPTRPGVAATNTNGGANPIVRKPLPPLPVKPAADSAQVAVNVGANNPRGPKPLPPIPSKAGPSNKPSGGTGVGSKQAPDSGAP